MLCEKKLRCCVPPPRSHTTSTPELVLVNSQRASMPVAFSLHTPREMCKPSLDTQFWVDDPGSALRTLVVVKCGVDPADQHCVPSFCGTSRSSSVRVCVCVCVTVPCLSLHDQQDILCMRVCDPVCVCVFVCVCVTLPCLPSRTSRTSSVCVCVCTRVCVCVCV